MRKPDSPYSGLLGFTFLKLCDLCASVVSVSCSFRDRGFRDKRGHSVVSFSCSCRNSASGCHALGQGAGADQAFDGAEDFQPTEGLVNEIIGADPLQKESFDCP